MNDHTLEMIANILGILSLVVIIPMCVKLQMEWNKEKKELMKQNTQDDEGST